jgi:ribosome-associated translation inhibitor RaiA
MQVHFAYHHVPRTPQLESVIQTHVKKLEKLLSTYSPDLVHLHGVLESNAAHQNTVCSLNLSLPTGQLHAREEGGNLMTDLQACFNHVVDQVKKHKEGLRREASWRRAPRGEKARSAKRKSPRRTP